MSLPPLTLLRSPWNSPLDQGSGRILNGQLGSICGSLSCCDGAMDLEGGLAVGVKTPETDTTSGGSEGICRGLVADQDVRRIREKLQKQKIPPKPQDREDR